MRIFVPVLLSGALLLAACAGSDDGVGDDRPPRPSASTPSGATDDDTTGATPAPDPTLTAKPDGRAVSVAGTVRTSSEDRCMLLLPDDGGTPWVLVGAIADLADGARVTVTGRADTGTTSRCQSGPVLVVTSAQPGS